MQTHKDEDHEGVEKLTREFREVHVEETRDDPSGDFEEHSEQKTRELRMVLEDRAAEMVAAGESQIASGKAGERSVGVLDAFGVRVTRLPDDELALRVSVGKAHGVVGASRYLVFRGDPEAVAALIKRADAAMARYLKAHRKLEKRKAERSKE